MQPSEYAEQFGDIRESIESLIDKLSDPEYYTKYGAGEYSRDIAVALELGQKEVDLYTEIIDEIGADMTGFNEFSKRFDEAYARGEAWTMLTKATK